MAAGGGREAARQSDSARLWDILDRSLNEIFIFDPDTLRFEYVNAGAVENLGYSLEQLRGMTPLDIKPEHTEASFRAMVAPLLAGTEQKLVFQTVHERADGTTYAVEVHLQLVPHDGSRVFVAIINDITDKLKLEAQYRLAQKLESIGRLAGGVAHDFNNVLTVVLSWAEVIEEGARRGLVDLSGLQEIRRAAERARDLTQQLLAFARKQVSSPRNVALNQLLGQSEKFLRRVLGEDLELAFELEDPLWPVRLDPTQLEQVMLNLAVNARDAMTTGGRLTVETHNVTLDEAFVDRHPDAHVGPHVALVVSDTGAGIRADDLPHIFEPFFTTKEAGRGTGLGLATVYGIVRQSGGTIWVSSEPGAGTTFKLYFPRSTSPDDVTAMPASTAAPEAGGTERILLVEDEPMVRGLLARTLVEAGYQVVVAPLPAEALAQAGAAAAPFDLLLTDVVMPGMSGHELAAKLGERFPGLRVLFISGYTEDAVVHHGVLEAGLNLLAKPFTPSRLRERVREVLAAPPPHRP